MVDFSKLKIALSHEFIVQLGGAEQVLKTLGEIFPQATVHTLVADPKSVQQIVPKHKIITSFIQKLPLAIKKYKSYLILMPLATESFDLTEYDLVISDCSAYSKGVKKSRKTLHICYLHTPTRYLWGETDFYLRTALPKLMVPLVRLFLPYLRNWDLKASKRPDRVIANSKTIAARTLKYYNRKVDEVIYPSVDIEKFKENSLLTKDYYLLAGRLVPYKRYDIVIEAFNKLQLPLRIVGSGPSDKKLKELNSSPDTQFLGRVSDDELIKQYSQCKAYIFPALEDFGITPIEAMALGRPVIAFGEGGVTETVIDGVTGIFFDKQTSDSVVKAIELFKNIEFDTKIIRQHALKFSKERFKKEITAFIEQALKEKQNG